MSDSFQTVTPGTAELVRKDTPQQDPLVHFAAIADEIVAGFRHLSDMIPAAAPLARTASVIEARLAQVRAIIHPARAVEGPQQDHS